MTDPNGAPSPAPSQTNNSNTHPIVTDQTLPSSNDAEPAKCDPHQVTQQEQHSKSTPSESSLKAEPLSNIPNKSSVHVSTSKPTEKVHSHYQISIQSQIHLQSHNSHAPQHSQTQTQHVTQIPQAPHPRAPQSQPTQASYHTQQHATQHPSQQHATQHSTHQHLLQSHSTQSRATEQTMAVSPTQNPHTTYTSQSLHPHIMHSPHAPQSTSHSQQLQIQARPQSPPHLQHPPAQTTSSQPPLSPHYQSQQASSHLFQPFSRAYPPQPPQPYQAYVQQHSPHLSHAPYQISNPTQHPQSQQTLQFHSVHPQPGFSPFHATHFFPTPQMAVDHNPAPPTSTNPNANLNGNANGPPPSAGSGKVIVLSEELLTMRQAAAARRLGMSSSALSKRWREAMKGRKWPYRIHCKLDKEIQDLMSQHKGPSRPTEVDRKLSVLLDQRRENVEPAIIRL